MLRRVSSRLTHPFHCWTHFPYVTVSHIPASYEGIRRVYPRVLYTLRSPVSLLGVGYSRLFSRPVHPGLLPVLKGFQLFPELKVVNS